MIVRILVMVITVMLRIIRMRVVSMTMPMPVMVVSWSCMGQQSCTGPWPILMV